MTGNTNRAPNLRSIALPLEHGGWAFLLEPALLGLLVAPTVAGVVIALAALFAFLADQPLRVTLRAAHASPRRTWAVRFLAFFAALALVFAITALRLAPPTTWLVLLPALPLLALRLQQEANRQTRTLSAELSGAMALQLLAPAITLAAGWSVTASLLLWGILICRVVPSILFVRAFLRRQRNEPVSVTPVYRAHGLALLLAVVAALAGVTSWQVAVAMTLLWGRAVTLFRRRTPTRAMALGITELLLGIIIMVIIATGYWQA